MLNVLLFLTWVLIPSRESETFVFRINVPSHWTTEVLPVSQDTREANARISFDGVVVTFHTFPYNAIPILAQIARWQKQLGAPGVLKEISRSGFAGIRIEGECLIACAMKLDDFHASHLRNPCDYTIKATGNTSQYREEILQIMKSVELIDDLP